MHSLYHYYLLDSESALLKYFVNGCNQRFFEGKSMIVPDFLSCLNNHEFSCGCFANYWCLIENYGNVLFVFRGCEIDTSRGWGVHVCLWWQLTIGVSEGQFIVVHCMRLLVGASVQLENTNFGWLLSRQSIDLAVTITVIMFIDLFL